MFKTILIIAVLVGVFGAVGSMDYTDQVEQESHYTSMVCNGLWPDYQRLKPVCN